MLGSSSSDVSFYKPPTPLPFTPSPIKFFTFTNIPIPPLFFPIAGMSFPLSSFSTYMHHFVFLVLPLVVDLYPVLYPPISCFISTLQIYIS